MPNSKLKCRQCGEYQGRDSMVKTPGGNFCSFDHASQYARAKALKTKQAEYKAETKRLKAKVSQYDLRTRKRAAKEACHAYIRERDKYKPCICCGEPLGESFDAGHFINDGNHPFTRYDEDNIHGQRVVCNRYRGGDSGHYRVNLIERIGLKRVEQLEENKSKPIKRTAEDYKEIERYYKRKLRELKESRGE